MPTDHAGEAAAFFLRHYKEVKRSGADPDDVPFLMPAVTLARAWRADAERLLDRRINAELEELDVKHATAPATGDGAEQPTDRPPADQPPICKRCCGDGTIWTTNDETGEHRQCPDCSGTGRQSDPASGRCRNTAYDHDCHPAHARKYDGYCLACVNAGVPEIMADLAALREEVKRLRETLEFVRTERGG